MAEYMVRASALQGIRPTMEELGCDTDKLLEGSGLLGAERDPECWISYRSFLLLLEDAMQVTNCPHFGLELSRHQDISILGALGFVIQQAPDLRTALRELALQFGHHNQGADVSLVVESGIAQWRFTCKLEGQVPIRQQTDLVTGIGIDLMKLLTYNSWSPSAIYFSHAPPQDIKPYKKRFDCPIFFNWESTVVTFDADILDTPISEANPQLHRVLQEHLRSLQQNFTDDYCGQIRYLIQQAMTTGDCSIERVANSLAINKRTLQRQLKAQGTSYKDLLEEVRFDIAKGYLLESSGSLTALADMLCYSELSAFSNAFRQRYNVSPRQWKKQQAKLQPQAAY
jgi:AraC-like DNA-binding protein